MQNENIDIFTNMKTSNLMLKITGSYFEHEPAIMTDMFNSFSVLQQDTGPEL
jgi:hypothetical protein